MSTYFVLVAIPVGLLASGCYGILRRTADRTLLAATLTLLVLLQSGIVVSAVEPHRTLWLAAGIGALAAGAAAFALREDVRGLILFGGALAVVQLCDPLGSLLAAGMLPAAAVIGHPPREARKAAGFYSLLLFAPVLTAAGLYYFAGFLDAAIALPAASAAALPPYRDLSGRLAIAVLPLAVAAPALFLARRTPAGRVVLALAAATLFAMTVAAVMGAIREPLTLLSAAAPLTAAGVAARLGAAPGTGGAAVLASLLCLGLSWGAFALVGA